MDEAAKPATARWNLKRGLNRLFVVCAVCWYIGAGFALWAKWTTAMNAERSSADWSARNTPRKLPPAGFTPIRPRDELDEFLDSMPKVTRPVGLTFALLLTPPTLYGLAVALLWIVRGFRVEI